MKIFLALVFSLVSSFADTTLSMVSSNQLKFATNDIYARISTNTYNFTNIVNVQAFGAFGNNSIDNQTALSNSWKSVNDGNIWFWPPGKYRSTSLQLSAVKNNYTIKGPGATLLPYSTNDFLFLLTGTNITFEDITFDCDQKNRCALFANVQSKGWKFRNVKFFNGYLDNNIDSGGTKGTMGIAINRGCTDFSFSDCVFSNFTFTATGNVSRFAKGIYGSALGGSFPTDADKNFIIRGCFFYNIQAPGTIQEGDCIELTFPNGSEDYKVNIVGNIFQGFTARAIKVQFSGYNITGNTINSLLTPGSVQSLAAIGCFGKGTIANNSIIGPVARGIAVSSTGTNNSATNIVIIGNQISQNGSSTSATNLVGIDVFDGATNVVVANNIIDNFFTGLAARGNVVNAQFNNNIVSASPAWGGLVSTNGNTTDGIPSGIYFSGNYFDGCTNGINVVQGSGIYSRFNIGSSSSTFINYAAGVTGSHYFNGVLPAITTATLDFPSIGAQTNADLTITVTGAATGDVVSLSLPAAPTAGISFNAFVSAADTVTVRANNYTGGSIDPASASYTVEVFKQ